jgi:hypothetical protein
MPGAFELNDDLDINMALNYIVDYDLLKAKFNELLSTSYETTRWLSCSRFSLKKNINNLTAAYSDYISDFLNSTPQYKEKLHDKFQKLRSRIQSIPLENCMIKGYEAINGKNDQKKCG